MTHLRSSLAAALLCALLGCAQNPLFTVTIVNDGVETAYIDKSTSGREFYLTELWYNGERAVSFDQYEACLPRCGSVAGVGCTLRAGFWDSYALLAGDEVSFTVEAGTAWVTTPSVNGSCVKQSSLSEPLSLGVCAGDAVIDFEGVPLEEPTFSGVVGSENGAQVQNVDCSEVDVDLSLSTALAFSLRAE